jgi:hypothetical protein
VAVSNTTTQQQQQPRPTGAIVRVTEPHEIPTAFQRPNPDVERTIRMFNMMALSTTKDDDHLERIIAIFHNSESLAIDSGAACHVSPITYATDSPLTELTNDDKQIRLMAVDGTTLTMYGRRDVFYEFVPGVVVRISFLVCDAKFPILAVRELHDKHGIGVHFDSRGGFRLELPGIDEPIPFEADSGIYSFTPFRRIPYSEVADFVQRIYKKTSIPIAPVGAPGAGRTDSWRPIGHGSELIRIHK